MANKSNKTKTDILRENIFKRILSYNLLDEKFKPFTIKGRKRNNESIILFNEELIQQMNTKGKYVISELGYNTETHQYIISFGCNRIDLYSTSYQKLKSGYDRLLSKSDFNREIDYLKSVIELNDRIKNKYFHDRYLVDLIFKNQFTVNNHYNYNFSNNIDLTKGLMKLKSFKLENGLITCEGLYYIKDIYHSNLNIYIPWFMFGRNFKFKYHYNSFKDIMHYIDDIFEKNGFIDEKSFRLLNKKIYYNFITQIKDNYTNTMRKINVLTGSANIEIVDLSNEDAN